MNLAELERKMVAAARAHPPGEAVPFAFEQRVLARLRDRPARDLCALWAAALWRAAAPCVAIAVLLGAWTWFAPGPPGGDLSQAWENSLLAAADQEPSTDVSW